MIDLTVKHARFGGSSKGHASSELDMVFVLECWSSARWRVDAECRFLADSTHSRKAEGCRRSLQSGCSHRLPAISMERIAATEACTTSTSIEPNSLHHKGLSRRTQKNPLASRAANPAARKPAANRQSQAPHVAPSRSPETALPPCEPVQPQAKAGCPVVEARHHCTSRCLPRGRPTGELRVARGCFREDPPGLGRCLRKLPACEAGL